MIAVVRALTLLVLAVPVGRQDACGVEVSAWLDVRHLASFCLHHASSMLVASLQIAIDQLDEQFCGLALFGSRSHPWPKDVAADVPFEHFRHQSVDRAAGRRDELQHRFARGLRSEGSLYGVDLSAETTNSVQEPRLVRLRVRHGRAG